MVIEDLKNKYPRIGEIENRFRNTSEKCPCGKMGRYRLFIQVDWFRGNDKVAWRCEDHKRIVCVELAQNPLGKR